jgi:lipopolysaccharide assembly outer membrane protein LptD (OstA)
MRNLSIVTALVMLLTVAAGRAQEQAWVIESLSPQNDFIYDLNTSSASGTNGVIIKYGGAILTADQVTVSQKTGEALADGHVRIQRDDQVWVGEHISYNFKTRMMETAEFRSGKPPVFVSGHGLSGDLNGQTYTATNAIITTDDFSEPAIKIRARRIKMVPGKYIEARDALLMLDGVPVFYLPYYRRNLGEHANNFNFSPGYRSRFGPFLLTRYDWYFNEQLDGRLHLDYRVKRGVGVGPDVNYHLGPWGDGSFRYYYLHDDKPGNNANGVNVPANRQRINFSYLANPATNLTIRSQVRYQGDPLIIRDFIEGEYSQNSQPSTYIEVNKFWDNFSLSTVAQPRINEFQQTVERLPDVRLTGFRQQLGNSPVYYESESSFAYLRQRFAVSNSIPLGLDYSAARADTYHQLLVPYSLFGWLNVVPHAGGRFTYYGEANGPGANTSEVSRGVFDTGLETSFKVSKVWPDAKSKLFDMSGLRHIMEPSADYMYVPAPNRSPTAIPQFDTTLPSLRLLPNEFPEMNSIDNIDSENVLRLGLRNKLQTKRNGEIVDLLKWEVYSDWRLRRAAVQTNVSSFSDIYSDLNFTPRSWLTFESQTRFDTDQHRFRLAYHTVTFQPNNTWSWSLGHFYVHDDPVLGTGNNLITSRYYYRFNENWGAQIAHQFEARNGTLQEQDYTIYRDLRSWTTAVTFRVSDNPGQPTDYTIALTFSLKAIPRFGLGGDSVRPYSLFGG